MPHALMIASQNRDKIKEIRQVLADPQIILYSLDDFPDLPEVVEDCDTIKGNAIKKAIEIAAYTGMYALADDTGLFIEALDDRPGVYAARYAFENCTYEDNQNKVLMEMQNIKNRKAEFRTAVALANPDGLIAVHEGIVAGEICTYKRGNGGFGYDPIFLVTSMNKTFAEMTDDEKNSCSHRALAIKSILPLVKEILTS